MSQTPKKQLRNRIRQAKALYTPEQLSGWSSTLFTKLESHPAFIRAKNILLYYSLPDEVQTHEFITRWHRRKQIFLPAIAGDELELRLYTSEGAMKKDIYGIDEPTGKPVTNYESIDLAIIPGMAFDKQGNRLGRGKGFYDRLLPRLKAYKIGVCFAFQVVDSIPSETFDVQMNEVMTEECIL